MKNVLVCGGAGYIGSHCIRVLRDAGYNCIVFDNMSEGHISAVRGYTLIEGDIADTALLRDTMTRFNIDSVMHFAAFALVGVSMKQPIEYYRNNICGSVSILEAMRDTGVSRIVFSSTCTTYGDDAVTPITEDTMQNPCNPYGETKLSIEKLLRRCDEAYGIKSVSLRYFNAAGAMPDGSIGEDHLLETHLIPIALQEALTGEKKLEIYGLDYPTPDGSPIRDYIHVLDISSAHLKALQYLENGGKTDFFNLGTGTGYSVLGVIKAIQEATGINIAYSSAERRPGDPAVLIASADKAKDVLGWIPTRSELHTIIKDAWAWHKTHPNGYEDK